MDYGKAIRIIRSVAGLQQKELAELAGVDASLISLIEKGKRQPGLSTVGSITKALSVPQHLFTLLAAEPDDLKTSSPEDVQRATESLARILLANVHKPQRGKSIRRSRKKSSA
jgi:XRE family transcriptional regulator, fatty acid utilization regulator